MKIVAEGNENRWKRLRWGCRRGLLELDKMLMPFFDERFQNLSLTQKQAFETLLTYSDQQLLTWFWGDEKPDNPALVALIAKIKAHGI